MTAGDIRRQLDDDMWDSMLRRTAEYRQELLRKRAAMTTAGDDIVERAAAAIYESDKAPHDPDFDRIADTIKDAYRKAARAALAAAGPGREAVIEECARRIDSSVFASSSRSRAIAFKDAAKIIRALASQPAKPVVERK
jgi:hypothetical protein